MYCRSVTEFRLVGHRLLIYHLRRESDHTNEWSPSGESNPIHLLASIALPLSYRATPQR